MKVVLWLLYMHVVSCIYLHAYPTHKIVNKNKIGEMNVKDTSFLFKASICGLKVELIWSSSYPTLSMLWGGYLELEKTKDKTKWNKDLVLNKLVKERDLRNKFSLLLICHSGSKRLFLSFTNSGKSSKKITVNNVAQSLRNVAVAMKYFLGSNWK